MIWPVTILGIVLGFWLADIPGALLGLVLGMIADRYFAIPSWKALRQRIRGQQSSVYSAEQCQFMLLGYLAKLNGRVLPAHIQCARMEMQRVGLDGYRMQAAIAAFSQGKHAQLVELRSALQSHFKKGGAERLLLSAWRLVWAERKVSPLQRKTMEQCAKWLDVPLARLVELEAECKPKLQEAVTGQAIEKALNVLGMAAGTRNYAQIKRAYRRLLSEHHPDKLTGAGATRQQIERAKDKTQELHQAFDVLRKHFKG